eukprot:CAMPEP_0172489586 /NCGR_PEP_ID=MMETSP1066-20121228/19690_1 /TAXON_ID=671091 /ORGANISM="Coscinodiscus wailesii, Strain CCMP2513" /LENGTH=739 /DNA_ID=CAMNT_0013257559 /DNA_START=289 /DNA_END=2505 /DNA_ORIENTATION=-
MKRRSSDDADAVSLLEADGGVVDCGDAIEDDVPRSSSPAGPGGVRGRLYQMLSKVYFPKVEPLPWLTFFELALVASIPAIAYILFFTKMGFGLTTFYYLSRGYQHIAPTLATGITGLFLLLYISDFSYWGTKSEIGRDCYILSWLAILVGVVVLVLVITQDFPYGPICLLAVLTPIMLTLVKLFSFPNQPTKVYVAWLSGPLFFISVLTGLGWVLWTYLGKENEWGDVNRVSDSERVGCEPDFNAYPECKNSDGKLCVVVENGVATFPDGCSESCVNIYDSCLNTFIVWVGPLLVCALYFFLSFFCTFLRQDTPEAEVVNFGKLWVFLLFAMWCTASLIGAGDGVTSAMAAFTLTSFVGSFVFLAASFSRDQQKDKIEEVWGKLVEKYGSYLDVAKGLIVVTCSPVFLVYIVMSFMNQMVRKIGCPCTKNLQADDLGAWVTRRTRKQINGFRTWDHGKVFTYAIYWGMAFMAMQVLVSQFTLLFLSWLIEQMQDFSVWVVTGIMVMVGLTMFLLPPVPGVPIYLTLGIVVIASGREQLGIVGAILYCNVVSLAMKLFACTLQQKAIGENLSRYVSIRQMCQMNSHLIRSMRLILSEQGLSVSKVAILVGGPDWPTSVLCGIMRLGLFQILLGTIPVIFLIIPTILTGSFTYMASMRLDDGTLEFPWAGTLATMMTAITGLVQFGSMIVAAFYLEKVAEERADELEQIPIDEEVRRAEEKDLQKRQACNEVRQWHVMPVW